MTKVTLDPFWTKVQGWYNPATFSMTEVTGSLLDICPRMIQSLFILEDRGLRITLGQVPRDDTIPLQHHYSPFRGRSFWTTPSLSRKCSNFTRYRGFVSASSKPSSSTSLVCEYWTITICISSMWVLKASSGHHHLHLYLECRNTGFLCVTMEHRVLCYHNSHYHIESM